MSDAVTADLPTNDRDRLREIIRSEVAKSNPIDDARRPVELIVETSVRLSGRDGRTLEVIDETGQLRPGMTVQDVLEELRTKHPTLFKPRGDRPREPQQDTPDRGERPGITVANDPGTAAPAVEAPPAPRDWLIIGEGPRNDRNSDDRYASVANSDDRDLHDRGLHDRDLHDRDLDNRNLDDRDLDDRQSDAGERRSSLGEIAQDRREALSRLTQDLRSRFGSAAETVTTGLQAARGNVAHSFDDVQHEIFRNPPPRLKAGHVLGALGGVLALAVVAYFVYSIASLPFGNGLAGPSQTAQAPTSEPVETGTVSAGSTTTAATPPPPSNGPLRGVPEVLDTATLWLQGKIVHLYGVEWVRGGGDPEEFTRYLRAREVTCDPVENVDAYRCKVDGKDLSEVVLFNGGGRTTANAPPDLRAAEERAKTAKLGVWNK